MKTIKLSYLLIFCTLFFLGFEIIDQLPNFMTSNYILYKTIHFIISSLGLIMLGKNSIYKEQDEYGLMNTYMSLYIPVAIGTVLYSIFNFQNHNIEEFSKIVNAIIVFSYSIVVIIKSIKTYGSKKRKL